MQDKKYIPIVAAVLVLAALGAAAYYLLKARTSAPTETPGQRDISAVLEALSIPSGEQPPSKEEVDKLNKALSEPAPKGSTQTVPPADVIDALSMPAQ